MSLTTRLRILDLFAGPGGWDMGARILGITEPIHGYDTDPDACATATAAGFLRTQASVTDLTPDTFRGVTGVIVSPPCPTFSAAGKRSALQEHNRRAILDAITQLGDSHAGIGEPDAYTAITDLVTDQRSALVVQTLRFALHMPHVQWVVAEQVPAVTPIWQEMAAELAMVHNFASCAVVTVNAEDLGVASRRSRTFLIATRNHRRQLNRLPAPSWWTCGRFEPPAIRTNLTPTSFPRATMAQALGWPAAERINTRGNRRTPGGNEFSADQPSWCLTEKARSWKRVSDGAHLTDAQAGLLTGFPLSHPWQGSRSKRFLQAADVVSPPVAAAILGTALGLDWPAAVHAYLATLYPIRRPTTGYTQPGLFEDAA